MQNFFGYGSGVKKSISAHLRYLGVVFTSDGMRNKIDARIGEAKTVLCEVYRSVVTKQEL